VLVVGAGQSGCQIADELNEAGRRTYLSVGRCPWFPRRYRGREILAWVLEMGMLDDTVESLPSPAARLACNPPVSGNDGGHDCHPRWLAARGTVLVGRVQGFRGDTALLGRGLAETLAGSDEFVAELTRRIDAYVEATGLECPAAEPPDDPGAIAERDELDLRAERIGTILWANGFRPDLSWIDLPLQDEHGWPVQERGVTGYPGLYFVGLNWLHKRKSALFLGVGEDAEHVAGQIAAR
jgi:putative flavoprotein involved in K+ transport